MLVSPACLFSGSVWRRPERRRDGRPGGGEQAHEDGSGIEIALVRGPDTGQDLLTSSAVGGAEPESPTSLFVDDTQTFERLREDGVHHFTEGVVTLRMTSETQVGA